MWYLIIGVVCGAFINGLIGLTLFVAALNELEDFH